VKLGIAIPTYNEADNITALLDGIYGRLVKLPGLQTTVLVIDDGSPDGTADLVRAFAKTYNGKTFKVSVMQRKVKDGLGRAYIAGFAQLLDSKPDYILQMDADLSHNPVYLPAFVKAAKHHDLVVGSRYIPGGETPDWSLTRRIQSWGGNTYARLLLGSKITDYTGGYNMYSAALMRKINPQAIESTGYGFLIELKYKAALKAGSIHQIPIVFHDRQHGKSKIPRDTIIKNFLLVPKLRLQTKGS
jgi:dolichol-phosphate mannosyltransferase